MPMVGTDDQYEAERPGRVAVDGREDSGKAARLYSQGASSGRRAG